MNPENQRPTTRSIGTQYEEKAATYLEAHSHRILEKNVNYRWGEIDLVAVDLTANELVFVEVRHRCENGMASPAESVTMRKLLRLKRAIETYLVSPKFRHSGLAPKGLRIDLIAFEGETITHFKNFA